jgi:hypothetical protein
MYKLVAFMIIVYLVFLVAAGWWVSKELSAAVNTLEKHPECVSEVCA